MIIGFADAVKKAGDDWATQLGADYDWDTVDRIRLDAQRERQPACEREVAYRYQARCEDVDLRRHWRGQWSILGRDE